MTVYNLSEEPSEFEIDQFDIERDDRSLNDEKSSALRHQYNLDSVGMNHLFLSAYDLEYVADHFARNKRPLRVISYPKPSNTCYEKASLLMGWNPLNVVKAFYLQSVPDGGLYGVIVPETGCFLDRNWVHQQLGLPADVQLVRAKELPRQMSFGTCSPFIKPEDLWENGGPVKKIIFDKETLVSKRHEAHFDDFSFGLDHHFSIQMNYYHCFKMLRERYRDVVLDREVLRLAFNERLVRKKGRIKIDYEFKSLNYRTACFINNIHGYGDVTVVNDHIDELFVPEVLTTTLEPSLPS